MPCGRKLNIAAKPIKTRTSGLPIGAGLVSGAVAVNLPRRVLPARRPYALLEAMDDADAAIGIVTRSPRLGETLVACPALFR